VLANQILPDFQLPEQRFLASELIGDAYMGALAAVRAFATANQANRKLQRDLDEKLFAGLMAVPA
jgi:hypothetical protein